MYEDIAIRLRVQIRAPMASGLARKNLAMM
jgi:hypothetical protein